MSDEKRPSPPSDAKHIAHVRFVESVPFMGTEASYAIVGSQHAERIIPARMEADGSVVAVSSGQRADGLLLVHKKEHVFVPWANMRGVVLK